MTVPRPVSPIPDSPAPDGPTAARGWFADNSLAIGNTPLVRLQRLPGCEHATLLAKIEGRNPAYSVKCRIGAAMVHEAERSGRLRAGQHLVEPTSGNTGIALAFVAAARGHRLTLTMPETMSRERRQLLKVFGAELVLTDGKLGMRGAIAAAEAIVQQDPQRFVLLQQFRNPANPLVHEHTTGPELWAATDGRIDVLVSGVGTGGTITGISRYWERVRGRELCSVAVEPAASPVLTQRRRGDALQPEPHKIQGIGAGFVPDVLDLDLVDAIETVTDDEAMDFARRLARDEGILAGISCGAATAVASRLAQRPEHRGQTIAVVLPDSGERYLSTALFADVLAAEASR
jgi:cysteine synthase